MNMRFLVDENLGNRFATLLKQAGYDAVLLEKRCAVLKMKKF